MATKKPYTAQPIDTVDFDEVMRRLDEMPSVAPAVKPERSTARAVGDVGLSLGQGAVGAFKALTDLGGADNRVSQGLGDMSKFLGEQKSEQSQATMAASQARIQAAEESGSTMEEVKAYMGMLWDQPAEMLAQGVGSFATMGLGKAASALKLAGAARAAGVSKAAFLASPAGKQAIEEAAKFGFKANIGVGAGMGVGAVKGSQYEQTEQNALKQGMGPEDAQALATEAQRYGGPGTMQQVLGGGLGALAAATGPVERLIMGRGVGQAGMGTMASMGKGFLVEGSTEGAQGAQERFAGNTAAIDSGVLDPSRRMQGVAGQFAMEGTIGGLIGGAAGPFDAKTPGDAIRETELVPEGGPMTRAANVATEAKAQSADAALRLGFSPLAGTPVIFADGSVALGSEAEQARREQLAMQANIEQEAAKRAPRTAGDTYNLLAEAKERGLDYTVALHPAGGGFLVVPKQWVTPQAQQEAAGQLMETIGRMRQADAAPVQRAPRTGTTAQELDLSTDPVTNYVNDLRQVNTPAAKLFVRDFDAGSLTADDVRQRMDAERTKTPDERLAAAAAEGLRMNPKGDPFKTMMAAQRAAKQTPGEVVEVQGGYAIRQPQESASDPIETTAGPTDAGSSSEVPPTGAAAQGALNVQDAPQPAAGTQAQAAPGEAPAPAGRDAAAIGGVPATRDSNAVVPDGLIVTFGGKSYPVKSIREAQEKWVRFQNTAGVGVSEVGNGVQITDAAGQFVARVSYNGRAWASPDVPGGKDVLIAEAPDVDMTQPMGDAEEASRPALPKPATAGAGDVEADGVGGEFVDLFDEQGRPKFSNAQSVKDFKKRTGLGQDGVRAIQAAVQDGRPITVGEARQADIAGQERRNAALEQNKAESEAEAQRAKENAAKPADQRTLLGEYEIPGIEGTTNRVRVFQQGERIEAVGLDEGTANNDLSRLIQAGQTVEQALATLYGDHGPNEAPNPSRVKLAGQPAQPGVPSEGAGASRPTQVAPILQNRNPNAKPDSPIPPMDIRIGDKVLIDDAAYTVTGSIPGAISADSAEESLGGSATAKSTKFLRGDDAFKAKMAADKAGLNEKKAPMKAPKKETAIDRRNRLIAEREGKEPTDYWKNPKINSHEHGGRADFKAGKPRELPSYFTEPRGGNAKAWLRGWDRAQADAAAQPKPAAAPATEPARETVVNVPKDVSEAIEGQLRKQKARIARLKREAEADGISLDEKKRAQTKVLAAETTLRKMRTSIFEAEDAAIKALASGNPADFAVHADIFSDAADVIQAKAAKPDGDGQQDENDAEMLAYESGLNANTRAADRERAAGAAEQGGQPFESVIAKKLRKIADDVYSMGTNNGARALDTRWAEGAITRNLDASGMMAMLGGKQFGAAASAKIALDKGRLSVEALRKIADKLDPEPQQATPSTSDLMEAAQRASKLSVTVVGDKPNGYTSVGKNEDGKELVQDVRGVRSYVENGIRISEPVAMRPGSTGVAVSIENRRDEFKTVEELGQTTPRAEPTANTIFTEDAAAAARARLKAKLGRLNSGLDPEMMMDGITLAGYHIEKGARTFAAYAKAMVADLGDGVKPYLKSWYMGVKYDPRASAFDGMDGAAYVENFKEENLGEDVSVGDWYNAIDNRTRGNLLAKIGINNQAPDTSWGQLRRENQPKIEAYYAGLNTVATGEATKQADIDNLSDKAETGAKEDGNATRKLDSPSTGALGGVPSGDVQPTDQGRDAGEGADRGGRGDGELDAGADDAGVQGARGLGDGAGGAPVSTGGGRGKRGGSAKRGVSRSGRADEGMGLFGASGGLTPDANSAPNAPQIAAPQPTDFTITDELALGEGGQKTKFKNNVAAIRLLNELESTGRLATPDEQAVLAKYVGWGGLPQAFDPENTSWAKEHAEIKALMSPDDLAAAARSTRYAHYTSKEIIQDGIYAALRQFGFTGGKTLEAGAGVGNFIGLMPADMRSAGRFTAIEREPFSSAIARQLYPQQGVQRADFTEFKGNDGYFDAAVGNPPFASDPQTDRSGRKHLSGLTLHNYFFAKSIDMLREGGIMAQVVTNSFLDAKGDKARKYISDRVEFLGAIRLPNSAFLKNAGTEVTTDIIFLKKRPDAEVGGKAAQADAKRWLDTGTYTDKNGKAVALNQYFIDNPNMMLGDFGAFGTMYGPDKSALVARPGQDTFAMLKEAVGRLPKGVYQSIAQTNTMVNAAVVALKNPTVKEGGYFMEGDKLMQRLPDIAGEARGVEITPATQWTAKTTLGESGYERIKALSAMRATVRGLIAAEMSDDASSMKALRVTLNEQYDAYRDTHGLINDSSTLRVFDDDPDYPLLASLEHGYTPGIGPAAAKQQGIKPTKSTAKKGPIFSQRVVAVRQAVQKVDTPADALAVSMAERGRLDAAYIGELLGMDPEQVLNELSTGERPLLFRDPATDEYVLRDAYLSGNVRAKLVQARQAGMFANVTALEAVQPEDVGSHEITARLGSPWVPTSIYQEFAKVLYGEDAKVKVFYVSTDSSFVLSVRGASEVALSNTWGTNDYPGDALLQAVMNNRSIKVTYVDSDKKTRTNVDATEKANEKASEIKAKFNDWLFADAERSEILTKAYNETNNNYVTRVYDGANMTFPGKVPDSVIKFRRHQRNAIARIVQDRTALLDHVVGAGKTFTVIAGAMELKRTGLARKPMVVVPNHLVKQWAADFYRLYPGANVLTATKKDFEKANRRKFLAKIATGDWDAVVIAHSSYGFIKPAPEFEAKFNQREIAKIVETIQAVEDSDGDKQTTKRTVKQLEGIKERLENRIMSLRDKPMDDLLDFEQIGVDQLFVDEAHMFKNLMYSTKMQGVAGLNDPTGSQRAYDMYVKTNQVMEKNGRGQGVVFATGTPVSNSLAEMYHMMRYLMPAQMNELGFSSFDAWANTYASVEQVWMQAPSGDGFKAQNRMSNFVNTPELLKMFDQVSDTVTMDDIKKAYAEENKGAEFPLPKLKGGRRTPVSMDKSSAQDAYMEEIAERAKTLEQRKGPPKKGEDNILVIMSDARKAAMDIRLVDPNITAREKGGRIDRSTDEVVARYRQYDKVKGTQIVFSDLGTPLKSAKKELKEYEALQARIQAGNADVATSAALGNEAAIETMEDAEAAQAELDAMGADWLSAVQSAIRGFSIYDDFKAALIEKGIPEAEIAFIHDYNTDDQKASLFRKVNAGQIRVLLGSTAKLGAGTNVQERLVAEHHLDVPWRPSDVEQREGRIERQGNRLMTEVPNFEIEILAYVTRDTLDMRMWQVQETKLKMINQLRTRKIGREIDNAFEDMELSAGEMQAAATGDINLLKEIQLRNDVKKLEQRRRAFEGQRNDLLSRKRRNAEMLKTLPAALETAAEEAKFAAQYQSDRFENRPPFKMNIDGVDYTDAKEAQEILRAKDEATEEVKALNGEVTTKKAPLSVTIDGELIKNRATMAELFSSARGDVDPIAWEFNGETYRRRTVLANAIRQRVVDAIADESIQQIGKIGAYEVAVEGSAGKGGEVLIEATMSRGGRVVLSNSMTVADSGAAPGRVVTMVENMLTSAVQKADHLERTLARARKDAADLAKTEDTGAWPDQGKLDAAREAHKAVLALLKKKDAPAGDKGDGDAVAFSRTDLKAAKAAHARISQNGVTSPDDLRDMLRVPGYSQWAQSTIVGDVGATKALRAELEKAFPGFDWKAPKLNDQGVITLYPDWEGASVDSIKRLAALADRYDVPVAVRGGAGVSPRLFEAAGFVSYNGMTETADRLPETLFSLIRPAGGITDTTPLFSFAGNTPAARQPKGLPASTTTQIVAAIKARWANAPEIVVAADMNDPAIPQAVRKADAQQRSQGATGEPEGFFYKGKVYVVAGALNSPADVVRVLFHETLGHAGLRGVFGESLTPILKQIAALRKTEVAAKAKEYGLDMSKEADRLQAAEEVLAVMAQTRPELGYVKRAIAAIRGWLRNHVPGFGKMVLTDADIIQQYILPARRFVEGGGGPRGGVPAPAFSRSDDAALSALRQADDLFAMPKSGKKTIAEITREHDPEIKVKEVKIPGNETFFNLTMADGTTARITVRKSGPNSVYDASVDADNNSSFEAGRPGENPEDVDPYVEDVWIDVSQLKPGQNGIRVYSIASTFAHNTGRIFIGDPNGLSNEAMRRRSENMLSSALKFGTTKHLAPHPRQAKGGVGVPALKWVYGDDVGNIERLIDLNLMALDNADPDAKQLAYDPETGTFSDATTGRPVTRAQLAAAATDPRGRSGASAVSQAGWRTVARGAVFRALLGRGRAQGDGAGRAGSGGRVLDGLVRQREKLASTSENQRVFYSRSQGAGDSLNTGDEPRFSRTVGIQQTLMDAVPQGVIERLSDMTTSQRGFNRWWHRTVGTQLHKAKTNKQFAPVYYAVQDFMKDVSRMATLAADQAPDLLPQVDSLGDVKKLLPQMGIAGNRQRKAQLKEASDALFDGTLRYTRDASGKAVLAQEDDANGIVWTTEELKARGMSAESIQLYRQARKAINQSLDNLLAADLYRMATALNPETLAATRSDYEALLDRVRKAAASDNPGAAVNDVLESMKAQRDVVQARIKSLKTGGNGRLDAAVADELKRQSGELENMDSLIEAVEGKVDRIKDLKASGYAPLMRFGQYTLDALDAGGDRVFFGMYESQMAANEAARKFRADGLTVRQGVQSQKEFELLKGVSPETAMLFADMMGMEKNDAMQSWLQNAVAQQSALKRHIRRKGVEGFDNDASRVVAAFLTSNSRAASRALHGMRIQERVENVRDGDVKDEAIALAEYVNNPKEEAQALRSLLFINYIGGSVASALVNLTQTVVQTLPYLSQYGGPMKAGKRIAGAVKLATGKIDDAELKAAVERAERDGIIKPQEVFQLQAEASRTMGSDIRVRAGLAVWGSFFQMAEVFNRRVAFMAAYQTAKDQGVKDAYAFAENAVEETQGTFNKGNRPNWARGAVGATLFTFKTFTIQYVEFLKRLPPKERALALGVLILLSGIRGLPFAEDAEDIVDTVAQQLGYNFTTKEQMDRFLVSTLGSDFADFLQHGASTLPGVPFDVSARLGMANLLPGTSIAKPSETNKQAEALEVFGVAGSFVGDIIKGEVRPIAIRNLAKGLDMYDRGIYTDTRGRKVMDVSPMDAVMKGIGLQPNDVAAESRAVRTQYEKRALFTTVKNDISEQLALGMFENNQSKVKAAREKLDDWNEKNPEARIVINTQAIRRRVVEMRRDRSDRFVRSAPKEMKAGAREALE